VVIAFSTSTVEPIAYGIKYNKFSKNVESNETYDGGWYFIGPLNSFIQFPKTQVNIDFSDLPGSKERGFETLIGGSKFTLHLSFQYQLIKDSIPALYKTFAQGYELNFIRVAKGAISQVTSNLTKDDLINNRQAVGELLRRKLDNDLRDTYAICTGL